MAYDTIMVFPDQFKKHILPEQIHILNVAFLVPEMRREFGGCGGNIAYNLKLIGGSPLIMATVGDDFTLMQRIWKSSVYHNNTYGLFQIPSPDRHLSPQTWMIIRSLHFIPAQ